MAKYAFNYDSGEYEYIERDGFSIDRTLKYEDWQMTHRSTRRMLSLVSSMMIRQ